MTDSSVDGTHDKTRYRGITIASFSVRDDAVAEQINRSMGRRVSLHYEEHVGVPTTCFAETPYFITAVRVVEDPHIVAPLPTPAAPPQPPAQQAPAERPPDGPQ